MKATAKAAPADAVNDDERLWTTADCAKYVRVCRRQFQDRIMCLPGFPAPIRLPTPSGGQGHPKWHPEEIKAWVNQHKAAA